ncbi:MAG: hypothetical protein S4CHLAM123_06740 [Chlamydiales bacterium]|nr:hypothetical protein [Chlamydiales bacterium]
MSSLSNIDNNVCSSFSRSVKLCEIEEFSPFDENQGMSIHIILHILSFLGVDDLGNCCLLSHSWKQLASDDVLWKDLQSFFPSLRVITPSDWTKYVDLNQWDLSFEDLVPLENKMMIPELKKFASLHIEEDAGFTLLTLPKNLSFNKLVEIATSQQHGNTTPFENYLDERARLQLNLITDTSYTILISNKPLKGSRGKTIQEQQQIVRECKCAIPGVLDVAALLALTHIIEGEFLFRFSGETRLSFGTYAQCLEQPYPYKQFIIGAHHVPFSAITTFDRNCYIPNGLCDAVGVVVMQKF